VEKGAPGNSAARLFHSCFAGQSARTLGGLLKAGHAAIDEHDHADNQGGGKKHVYRDGFAGK
jgi:hypothetical protein